MCRRFEEMTAATRKYKVLLISLTLLAVAAMITGAQIDFMRHINQNNTQTNNLRKERSISSNLPAYMLPYMLDEQVEADYGDELFSSLDKRGRETTVDFRPLCETTTKTVHLHDGEHEYQPAHYMETHCKTYNTQKAGSGAVVSSNQKCVYPGFSCMPRSQTMYFLRRQFNSECWESFTKEIPSGCDCMWPETTYGDISRHY